MSFIFHKEEDELRQLEVTVEVDEKYIQKKMRETVRSMNMKIQMPGFRRGKVPYQVILKRLGADAVRAETIEKLTQPVFDQLMDKELSEPPYARVSLQDVQLEPTVFTFMVPLAPRVTLGDYRSLRKEIEPIEIQEDAIEDQLKGIQGHHQILEPVERPAEMGDMIIFSGEGQIDDIEEGQEPVVLLKNEKVDVVLEEGESVFGDDFFNEMVGMSAEEEKTFTITLPEDFVEAEHAGKIATFTITMNEVKSRTLPEINDDLAIEEGDYESLEELRAKIADDLREQTEREARGERFDFVMDYLLEESEMVYSPILVDVELDSMVERLKTQAKRYSLEWEDYLKELEKTEEDLREEWDDNATQSVERGLILREIIQIEKLRVSDNEFEDKINQRFAHIEDEATREYMRKFMREGEGGMQTINEILFDKLGERFDAILSGTAPSLADLEEEEE